MLDAESFPRYKLLTEFTVTNSYQGDIESDIKEFSEGMIVHVIAKAFDSEVEGSSYVIYSPVLQESTTVHEMFLEGFNK